MHLHVAGLRWTGLYHVGGLINEGVCPRVFFIRQIFMLQCCRRTCEADCACKAVGYERSRRTCQRFGSKLGWKPLRMHRGGICQYICTVHDVADVMEGC
jgi:hypothetical protein